MLVWCLLTFRKRLQNSRSRAGDRELRESDRVSRKRGTGLVTSPILFFFQLSPLSAMAGLVCTIYRGQWGGPRGDPFVVLVTMTVSHLASGWRFGFFIAGWTAKNGMASCFLGTYLLRGNHKPTKTHQRQQC